MPLTRPTRDELLQVLHEALTDLAADPKRATPFELRVAARAVSIVQRELALGPEAEADDRARLSGLLKRDGTHDDLNRELCERLRDGRIRHDDPALLKMLRASVEARLAIDNPDFH